MHILSTVIIKHLLSLKKHLLYEIEMQKDECGKSCINSPRAANQGSRGCCYNKHDTFISRTPSLRKFHTFGGVVYMEARNLELHTYLHLGVKLLYGGG